MFLSEGRNYGLTVPSWDSGTSEWNREPVPWVTPKLVHRTAILALIMAVPPSPLWESLSLPAFPSLPTPFLFLMSSLPLTEFSLEVKPVIFFPMAQQFAGLYYQQGPSQLAPILELCHGYLIRVWKWQNRSRSPFAPLPLLCMLCPPGTSLASGRQQDLLWTYILHGNLSVRWHCDWDLGSERGW